MNLGELITCLRTLSPKTTTDNLTDSQLIFFINEATKEVCFDCVINETEKAFNIVANQSEYSLTAIDDRLIAVNDSGVYWFNGTNYKQLDPKTRKYLDEKEITWRNRTAGTPQSYFIEGDIITIHPTPDTSISNGGKIAYIKRFLPMANNADCPFHTELSQSVQISKYDILSWSVVDKCLVYLNKVLDEKEVEIQKEQIYQANLAKRLRQLNTKRDLAKSRYVQMGSYYAPSSY